MLSVYAALTKVDPTRTLTLRNSFARDVTRRFKELITIVRYAIVKDDIFGLKLTNYAKLQSPGRQAFDYPKMQDRLTAFMDWIQSQVNRGILAPELGRQFGESVDVIWSNYYIRAAYQRGIERARTELIRANYAVPTIAASGGITTISNNPLHLEKLGLLYSQVYNELKGVTDAMNQQISRVLTQSMIEGKTADQIARRLVRVIGGPALELTDTLGRFIPAMRRAQMIARTETVRAQHLANIQEYRNWNVPGVRVKAEWVTAQDDRVCSSCASLEGQVFSLDVIEGMIPAHPNCRCIALPVIRNTRKAA